ncbi:lytic murein transglycosylase [Luteimonas aestuarii]|uniref:Lytic murein transglycosylase n=1 Tax=Luteimonas aestuarii TaxID=453837 RepID=A0A4R5TN92_9GAMM|nr:lytic murein transglycosylase [Luteimonas aestuarii]TDK23831.1 lytic murein transglycosylase [Luteimonas aestuarii]
MTRLRFCLPLLLVAPVLQAYAQATPVSAPDPEYDACMVRMKAQAASRGVPAASFDRFMADVTADRSVLDLLNAQPEFTTPIWDYLAGLVDDERVADGRTMLDTHRELLARVEREYGVDPATVVAVWGVESDFGRISGRRPLLQSLSTLSCFGRRQEFFRGEFIATLKLLHDGDLRDPGITGSWAGAFGHTQFMPTTYARIAVDFDGDGRRDLVTSIPDSLASTANYLKRSGWQTGRPWGHEVKLPANFDTSLAGRTNRRPLSDWVARGVTRVDGTPLTASDTRSALILPAGRTGPAFVVFRNYDAIYSYNAAESYALAIATLADRLRGGSGLAMPWPTDDPGLSRAQRRELQTLLLAHGHDIGVVDGMIGTNTRRAIRDEQQRLGLSPADGRAGQKILEALRALPPGKPDFVTPPSSGAPTPR